jgi:hypothetical protein
MYRQLRRTLYLALLLVGLTSQAHAASPSAPAPSRPHPTPRVPLIIDGMRVFPDALQRYAGQHLIFVLTPEAQAQGVMYAFTSRAAARHHLANQISTALTATSTSYTVYNWTNYGNDAISFDQLASVGNLGSIRRGPWPFSLWQTWNDEIESIRNPTGRGIVLFMDPYFEYGEFIVAPGTNVSNLNVYGWGNVASSLGNCNFYIDNQSDSCFGVGQTP